jgi:hypothetical protein
MLLWLSHHKVVGWFVPKPSSLTNRLSHTTSHVYLAKALYSDSHEECVVVFYFFDDQEMGVFPKVKR